MNNNIEEELAEIEPQVTSSDPEERKLARRLRIERRLEAIRKQNLPEEEIVHDQKELTCTESQLKKSAEVLKRLLEEGEERVTNIRVANDQRETSRREAEGIGRAKIIQSLEEEASLAEEQFQLLSKKWSGILKASDPLHINDQMMQQKEKCDELIKQKDGIIAMLKEEIIVAEKKFSKDQRKQIDDICLLTNRIEKQVSLTRRAYREQLNLIEEATEAERKLTIEANDKKWEELYKKRDQEEELNAEKKIEQMEYFEIRMTNLRREFQEKFRATKIKLERDIDDLEVELEKIKALALLNSEKLDYNYQILKKREDENIIIKSQQKRRINKLQDIVNTLKRKITDYDGSTKAQIVKYSAEIVKLQKNILDLESKADHFAEVNDDKFNQLWDMNRDRAVEVAQRILTIDRILHEHLLGVEWNERGLLKRKELRKENLPSYREALEILEQEALAGGTLTGKALARKKISKSASTKKVENVQENLLSRLLKQIADRTGFIMEDRLITILQPYQDSQQDLVRMDNIFCALNITKDADINEVLRYFLPYTHCPVCSGSVGSEQSSNQTESEETTFRSVSRGSRATQCSQMRDELRDPIRDENLLPSVHLPLAAVTNIVSDIVDNREDEISSSDSESLKVVEVHKVDSLTPVYGIDHKKKVVRTDNPKIKVDIEGVVDRRLTCQNRHPLLISSVYILKALRHFINNYYTQQAGLPTMGQRLSHKRNTICRLIKEVDIKAFWNEFRNIFTEENEKLWDALEVGLGKYHDILKDRANLNDEVVILRKKNDELKEILKTYLKDPTDPNLIPPCAAQRIIPTKRYREKK